MATQTILLLTGLLGPKILLAPLAVLVKVRRRFNAGAGPTMHNPFASTPRGWQALMLQHVCFINEVHVRAHL
jgi:hypothetical protein